MFIFKENDKSIKAEQKFNAIKQSMLNFFPTKELIIQTISEKKSQLINKKIQVKQEIKEKTEYFCYYGENLLEDELKLIEEQKFKGIIRNRGEAIYLSSWLMIYLLIDCLFSILFTILQLRANSKDITKQEYLMKAYIIGKYLIDFLECTLMAFLFYKATLITSLFGFEEDNIYDNNLNEEKIEKIKINESKFFSSFNNTISRRSEIILDFDDSSPKKVLKMHE